MWLLTVYSCSCCCYFCANLMAPYIVGPQIVITEQNVNNWCVNIVKGTNSTIFHCVWFAQRQTRDRVKQQKRTQMEIALQISYDVLVGFFFFSFVIFFQTICTSGCDSHWLIGSFYVWSLSFNYYILSICTQPTLNSNEINNQLQICTFKLYPTLYILE